MNQTPANPIISSPDVAAVKPESEKRQVYGTAKTENLRDSGLWRILLPGFVVLCCLLLLAVPLIILIPLLSNSLDVTSSINPFQLTWVWIVMIILSVGLAAVLIGGLIKIFMTQAGNYRS